MTASDDTHTSDRMREHDVALADGDVRLRPMTEGDWDILLPWIA